MDNDFYLKENPDGTVVFESVPNKGRYINISTNNQTIRNFSINLLVRMHVGNVGISLTLTCKYAHFSLCAQAFAKGKGTTTVTK